MSSIQTSLPFKDLRKSPIDVFPELHHYTTLTSLNGILTSNSLWATSYHFLNDRTEIVHIEQYLEDAIAPILDKYVRSARKLSSRLDVAVSKQGGPRSFGRKWAHTIVGRNYDALLRGLGPSRRVHYEPFVVSFCSHQADAEYEKNNGLLSQWRGYASVEGVAIVFDTRKLIDWYRNDASKYEYPLLALCEVFYNEGPTVFTKQFPVLIPTLLKYGIDFLDAAFSDSSFYSSQQLSKLLEASAIVGNEFVQNICRFKHRGFREEREIRIVACPLLSDDRREFEERLKPIMTRGLQNIRYIQFGSHHWYLGSNTVPNFHFQLLLIDGRADYDPPDGCFKRWELLRSDLDISNIL